jgi:hypothetical protein
VKSSTDSGSRSVGFRSPKPLSDTVAPVLCLSFLSAAISIAVGSLNSLIVRGQMNNE